MNLLNLIQLILFIFSCVFFFFNFQILAIIHIALFLVFIILNIKKNIEKLNKQNFKYYLSFILIILAFFIINTFSKNLNLNYDLTENKKYSLNKEEINIFNQVKENITAYLITSRFNKNIKNTKELFTPFLNCNNSKIRIIEISEDRDKDIFEKYNLKSHLKGILVTNSKFVKLERGDKSEILAGLLNLSNKKLTKAYYIIGHSEPKLNNKEANGLSLFKEKSFISGYKIDELLLQTSVSIPKDAKLLIINNPKSDYSEHEISLIRDFLENGNNLILFTKPETSESINLILDNYGIEFKKNIIKQEENRITNSKDFQFLLNLNPIHSITKGLGNTDFILVNYSSYFQVSGKNSDRREYSKIITSSKHSYNELNIDSPPYVLGLAFNGTRFINEEDSKKWINKEFKKTKILCFSDNTFIQNKYLNSFIHPNLLNNSLFWMQNKNINYNSINSKDNIELVSSKTFNQALLINIIVIELMILIVAFLFII